MFLIDTVTISALRRRQQYPAIIKWIERQRATDLFFSVVSIGEIERRIARQRSIDPALAEALAGWIDRLIALYGEQIVPFDLRAARRWAR